MIGKAQPYRTAERQSRAHVGRGPVVLSLTEIVITESDPVLFLVRKTLKPISSLGYGMAFLPLRAT
jgi:hypothetical protein